MTGPERAKGYLNRPELTAEVFKGEWFYTGDLGKIDETGKLDILCRIKNLIIVDGREIYPDTIQEVLCSHPCVQDALVKKHEECLKAFVVINEQSGLIVYGENVRIGSVGITYGNAKLDIRPVYNLLAKEDAKNTFLFPQNSSIGDLITILQELDLDTETIIEMIKVIDEAGALFGKLIIR